MSDTPEIARVLSISGNYAFVQFHNGGVMTYVPLIVRADGSLGVELPPALAPDTRGLSGATVIRGVSDAG